MIQLTRLLAKQLRQVFRKALGISHAVQPPLQFATGAEGLVVQAQRGKAAVEYRVPGSFVTEELLVPWRALDDLQGVKGEASLYRRREGVLGATWDEKGVQRQMEYAEPPPAETEPFPPRPEVWAHNPPRLRQALHDACETADTASSRYALGCVQLRPDGSCAATDGRQLLRQRGFAWGLEEPILVPQNPVFACRELGDVEGLVGRTAEHAVFQFGPWTIWLPIAVEGRFPRVDDIVPATANADTVWDLAPADARFFAENVQRLPGSAAERRIMVDLNGAVVIRAKAEDTPQGTELVLRNSSKTGADVRIGLDRRNLLRAVEMGFEKIYLHGASAALLAQDDTRSFVWMPLTGDETCPIDADYLRIESPPAGRSRFHPRPSIRSHRMPAPIPPAVPVSSETNSSPVRRVRRQTSSPTDTGSLAQALRLRDQLRTNLAAVKELIRTLQVEHKSRRLLKATLDSLKDLHKAA